MQHSALAPPALTVVIPAYQEAARLPATLARVGAFLAATPALLPAQVVVVDDGSRDGTAELAAASPSPPGVHLEVLRHAANRGKGAAVRTGLAASRGAWVLISDADLATPIEELAALRAAAGDDSVAFGSRAVDRGLIAVRQPWYRDLMGRAFNLGVRLLAAPGFGDTQCGFKLLPGRLARQLATALTTDGFAWDVELLVLARHWGIAVREVAVRWRHVEASRVQPVRHSLEMARDVLRLWLRRVWGRLPRRPEA